MQASGPTEIIPFLCISVIWGQHPASWFFTDAGLQALFSLLGALRHQASHLEALNNWWLWHACLLMWQEIVIQPQGVFENISNWRAGVNREPLGTLHWCDFLSLEEPLSDRRAILPQSHHWEIWVGEVLPMLVWLFPDMRDNISTVPCTCLEQRLNQKENHRT